MTSGRVEVGLGTVPGGKEGFGVFAIDDFKMPVSALSNKSPGYTWGHARRIFGHNAFCGISSVSEKDEGKWLNGRRCSCRYVVFGKWGAS